MGARIKKTLEKEVQATCVAWLEWWGALPIRTNSGSMKIGKRFVRFNDEEGCGDVLCCLPDGGRFLSLELKKPGPDTTSAERKRKQARHRARVMARGGLAIVATSLDELRAGLQAVGYDIANRYEMIQPIEQGSAA
ncbi:hypothetical protein VT84_33270 [Gemmata sp. SH-PL17]|uniref:hypothetical protein n=1 Tax=Gemmata sp. SH-PL17 TaxID=1630693 RepID=UPI00078E0250|nr:hypothetical protein [Gemmata sp. SH-PL17]AMV29314.1 hypothetical protein VT84_33270 [Gemmata sp. SH-PL17]